MKKLLLFGASGHAGKAIARAISGSGYDLTVVVRTEEKARSLSSIAPAHRIIPVFDRNSLKGVSEGFDIVISALGRSVSINDKSKSGFMDVDYECNKMILEEAVRAGVKKFVYLSVLGAGNFPGLVYFKAHYLFEEELISSGLNYSIIRPPALFSAFLDLLPMAKKGLLATIGDGRHKTNPIDENDLARICVDSISESNVIIEAGGEQVLTRAQINEIIQQYAAPTKKIRRIPSRFVKLVLPMLRLRSRNLYDQASFFLAVLHEDVLAPPLSRNTLHNYLSGSENKTAKALKA